MLKKKARIIQFLRFEMDYSARGREVALAPNMRETLEKLQKHLEDGPLKKSYSNSKQHIGLRALEFNDEDSTAILLWGGGDTENVNPCFWDHVKDDTRQEDAQENEVVSFSCHTIIGLNPTPLGGYIMLKEQVPFFGKGIIEKALNSFFRSYSKDTLEDEDGDQFFATPKIKINSLPSQNLKESFEVKTLRGIKAVRVTKDTNVNFDENFSVRKEDHAIKITPNEPFIALKAVSAITNAIHKLKKDKYEEIYIEYSSLDRNGTLALSIEELAGGDLETHLFERKELLKVGKPIEQQCKTIHSEMASRLSKWAVAELSNLEKKYACKKSPS